MEYHYILFQRINDEDCLISTTNCFYEAMGEVDCGFKMIGFFCGDFPKSIVEMEVRSMIVEGGL